MSVYLGNLELATGGGATGTGLPVNTYESFLVNSTGNPTGYNATTGLYTHPNGDYWLKTGSTLEAASATYPDAAGTTSINWAATGNTFTGPGSNAGLAAPTDGFLYAATLGGAIQKWSKAGVLQATLPSLGTINQRSFGTNGSNNLLAAGGGTVREYTTAGVATGFSFSYTGQMSTNNVYGVDSNGTYIWVLNGISGEAFRYTQDGVYTGFSITHPSNQEDVAIVREEALFIQDVSRPDGFDPTTGVALSASGAVAGSLFAPDLADTTKFWTNDFGDIKEYNLTFSKIFGDSTARTDPDSGQPLFIKLK